MLDNRVVEELNESASGGDDSGDLGFGCGVDCGIVSDVS